nr:hypothetical protein [Tanacetum cinerariifolium]
PVVVAPRAVEIADSPVSTSIEQDAPSSSIPSTQDQEHSLIISQGVEESPKTPLSHDDLLQEFLHEDSTSQGSSSNVRPSQTLFELTGRCTKDHPIANVIGDPSPGFESRPPMLNKENYVPWLSRLLWYAKSRPNGKLIYNSILNGPYVRQMIPEPSDANRKITVTETFHLQTDDELSDKELKQIEADDQAIQTILLGLPEDIYDKKAKLFNEWERFTSNEGNRLSLTIIPEWSPHVTIVHQTKDLHTADYTQLYNFLKYNQKENYLRQPMPNPEDIIDPTTAMNMALILMAKAFNLNYATPTNNNQRISSNPRNRQIAQLGMNMGQDRQLQMVGGNGGNQFRQYAGQNAGNPTRYNDVIGNQNQIGNGNLVAARAEGNAAGQNGNQIRCYNCRGVGIQLQAEEYDLMAAVADLDEIEEVNANCILMANLQQALTSEEQYTELLERIPESHQIP